MPWEIRQYDIPRAVEEKEGFGFTFTREMFEGSRLLGVTVVRGQPYISAVVDPTAPLVKLEFDAVGLGQNVYPHKENVFIGEVRQKDLPVDYFLFYQGKSES